jgi:hypothetical protein
MLPREAEIQSVRASGLITPNFSCTEQKGRVKIPSCGSFLKKVRATGVRHTVRFGTHCLYVLSCGEATEAYGVFQWAMSAFLTLKWPCRAVLSSAVL